MIAQSNVQHGDGRRRPPQGSGRRVLERPLEEAAQVAAIDRSELVHELRSLPGAGGRVLTLTVDLEKFADCAWADRATRSQHPAPWPAAPALRGAR